MVHIDGFQTFITSETNNLIWSISCPWLLIAFLSLAASQLFQFPSYISVVQYGAVPSKKVELPESHPTPPHPKKKQQNYRNQMFIVASQYNSIYILYIPPKKYHSCKMVLKSLHDSSSKDQSWFRHQVALTSNAAPEVVQYREWGIELEYGRNV